MTKKINWEQRCENTIRLYLNEHSRYKRAMAGWRETLDSWRYWINLDLIFGFLYFISGVLAGIIITGALLK